MKNLLKILSAAMVLTLLVAACDSSDDSTPDVQTPAELYVSPMYLGVLGYIADTVDVFTNTSVLTVDSIMIFRVEEEGYDSTYTYNFNCELRSGGSLSTDWLKLQFNDSVLRVISFAPDKPDSRLYQFKIFLSLNGRSQKIVEGVKDAYPMGWRSEFLSVEPSSITFDADGGTITCQSNNANILTFWIKSIEVDGQIICPEDKSIINETAGWLTVWRGEEDSIDVVNIKAEPNDSGEERYFTIVCQDVYDESVISGLQRAK